MRDGLYYTSKHHLQRYGHGGGVKFFHKGPVSQISNYISFLEQPLGFFNSQSCCMGGLQGSMGWPLEDPQCLNYSSNQFHLSFV